MAQTPSLTAEERVEINTLRVEINRLAAMITVLCEKMLQAALDDSAQPGAITEMAKAIEAGCTAVSTLEAELKYKECQR